jgi:UDP-N-acetylglucosamine:LPS N-acetylglucosamine transferase
MPSKKLVVWLDMKSDTPMKICIAASSGGHLSQMLKLADSWQGYETFYITTLEVVREKLQKLSRVYVVGECNHKRPVRVMKVMIRCIKVVLRERPDVVMSTGAAAGCMACFIAKLLGAKIIWIDSITNVERISLSGRMVRRIADLFLVQWPDLASQYESVEYVGEVI